MGTLIIKALPSRLLPTNLFSGIKSMSVTLFNRALRTEKADKAPVDFEIDNLDWYRTFKLDK